MGRVIGPGRLQQTRRRAALGFNHGKKGNMQIQGSSFPGRGVACDAPLASHTHPHLEPRREIIKRLIFALGKVTAVLYGRRRERDTSWLKEHREHDRDYNPVGLQ